MIGTKIPFYCIPKYYNLTEAPDKILSAKALENLKGNEVVALSQV